MEARRDPIPRTSEARGRKSSGSSNRRQLPRPLVNRELACATDCSAECLLQRARTCCHGRAELAQPAEPPDADPHVLVVWQGRRGDPSPYADWMLAAVK